MSSNAHPTKLEKPGQKDGREVEWQLACSDLGSVRRWLDSHGTVAGLVLEARSTQQIFDTYLDTDDWRIYRAGYALRIRSKSGRSEATLKSLQSARADVADRREMSETLDNSESGSIRLLSGPVGSRVHAVSGSQALIALFEVRTSRQRFAVRREEDVQQLGEIALDETVISRPHGAPQTSMQRVEVEASTESHESLESLVATLRNDCSLETASDSKYSQGLKSVGLAPGPAPEFAPMGVDPSMSMRDVALANLRRYWSAWHRHEPGARLGDDPEELHDLRVAGRRMDAIMREFRSLLPGAFSRLRPPLKKVLHALGDVRDLDVALGELDTFVRGLPESERASAEPLRRQLATEHQLARTRMLTALDSISVQSNVKKLTALLAAPHAATEPSPSDREHLASVMIRQRYRKVRKGANLLTADSPMEAYHDVRGNVKKLRYAIEAVDVIYGKPADEMLRALRRWQDKLGVQQDANVASRRLKELASKPRKGFAPETLFLMGRLAEHYARSALRARKLHAKGYRKVRGRWKRLRMKLTHVPAAAEPAGSGAQS